MGLTCSQFPHSAPWRRALGWSVGGDKVSCWWVCGMTTSSPAQTEAGQEGGGFPTPALMEMEVSAAIISQRLPWMKILHLSSVAGSCFNLHPWLSSWNFINCHKYWEATGRGGVSQRHLQWGLAMRHQEGLKRWREFHCGQVAPSASDLGNRDVQQWWLVNSATATGVLALTFTTPLLFWFHGG